VTPSPGRILCVTSSIPRWPGDSCAPFVLHLAQDLQELGWEIDVVAPHAPGAATDETLGGVHIERFRYQWPASQQTVCYGGGALVNLRRRPLDRLKLPALVAAEWAAVARRLARRRYAVLHSHWMLPQGLVGMLARSLGGRVAHVVTVHGGDLHDLRGPFLSSLKRQVLNRADAVTVNSRNTEEAVRALSPRAGRIVRIPMGVAIEPPDAEARAVAARLRSQYRRGQGPLVVFVGRLIDEKGPADLLHAIAGLRASLPGTTALFVGDGQDRPQLEGLARSLGLEDRVVFPGWIDPAAVGAWLAAADVFVGPSRRAQSGWVEAQGLTFLEAMVAGTPVVATRLGGIPDAVVHEETGLLVDERSPDQIAAAVRRLAADPGLGQRLAERARRHVASHFARDASARAFSDLFSGLIGMRA